MSHTALYALPLLLTSACTSTPSNADGGAPVIRASDFDQTCVQSTDCVAVEDDTPCCNVCVNAAVNKTALTAFNAERAKQAALCTPQDKQCSEIACNTLDHAACVSGTCVFVHCTTTCPDADGGADGSTD